jgi:hypothetical protein
VTINDDGAGATIPAGLLGADAGAVLGAGLRRRNKTKAATPADATNSVMPPATSGAFERPGTICE